MNQENEMVGWHPPQNYKHNIENSPLSQLEYWQAPDGKNLTILACLKWALTHLQHCQNELPCNENILTKTAIENAIVLQEMRQKTRAEQGVLGTFRSHESNNLIIRSH
jgi:hypothetical protein